MQKPVVKEKREWVPDPDPLQPNPYVDKGKDTEDLSDDELLDRLRDELGAEIERWLEFNDRLHVFDDPDDWFDDGFDVDDLPDDWEDRLGPDRWEEIIGGPDELPRYDYEDGQDPKKLTPWEAFCLGLKKSSDELHEAWDFLSGDLQDALKHVFGMAPTAPPSSPPRTEPRNLQEQLALNEAKGGAGKRIMGKDGEIRDPRYKPEDGWVKKSYYREGWDGNKRVKTEIHYWENEVTGVREGFKFK